MLSLAMSEADELTDLSSVFKGIPNRKAELGISLKFPYCKPKAFPHHFSEKIR